MYFTLVAHSTIVMFTHKLPAFGEITKLNKHSTNWNQIEFITFLSQFYILQFKNVRNCTTIAPTFHIDHIQSPVKLLE